MSHGQVPVGYLSQSLFNSIVYIRQNTRKRPEQGDIPTAVIGDQHRRNEMRRSVRSQTKPFH